MEAPGLGRGAFSGSCPILAPSGGPIIAPGNRVRQLVRAISGQAEAIHDDPLEICPGQGHVCQPGLKSGATAAGLVVGSADADRDTAGATVRTTGASMRGSSGESEQNALMVGVTMAKLPVVG